MRLPSSACSGRSSSYDRERRIHLDRASCYLTITRCKLLVHQVLNGEARRTGWKTEVFGGSERDGQVESRVFRLEYDPGADGRFARFPFRLTIATGPGRRTATGGISPDGAPTAQVSMRFPDDDFVAICLEVRDFLAAHQAEVEAVRRRMQREHFNERRREGREGEEQPRAQAHSKGSDRPHTVPALPFPLRRADGGEYPAGTPLTALDRRTLRWLAANARNERLKQAAEELAA
ncbi:MAG: hypothetical protein KatS3mg057_2327 [Herpetosiphonaceae bacterium]|nr:MAG: hypothetical protein KatS3mg057_2327 [Herpetosiphonaceae bacterium]